MTAKNTFHRLQLIDWLRLLSMPDCNGGNAGGWLSAPPSHIANAGSTKRLPGERQSEIRHKALFPLSYAGITQIRFKGTKASICLISARTAPLVDSW